MNKEEYIKMWEAAAMRMNPEKREKKQQMGPHDKAMSDIIGGARKAGRELTPSEKAALERHRKNAWDAAKKK